MWCVDYSAEYESWFMGLDEPSKEAVYQRVLLLQEFGPNLPRPYADTLKGSMKYKNLKELRAQTKAHVLRIAYYFDPARRVFLLTGGDKKGKNEERSYRNLIAEAEGIIAQHEEEGVK